MLIKITQENEIVQAYVTVCTTIEQACTKAKFKN